MAMSVIMEIEIYPSNYIDGSCLSYSTNRACCIILKAYVRVERTK